MSETPKVGDRVRVLMEGVVSVSADGGYFEIGTGREAHGFNTDNDLVAWTFLERADDPSKDPVGTVRENTGGFGGVYVKTPAEDDSGMPWLHMECGFRNRDIDSTLGKIVGVVPGTPAAVAAEPEYEYYRGNVFDMVYRLTGNLVEFYSDGEWMLSAAEADEVRADERWTQLDGKPSDVD